MEDSERSKYDDTLNKTLDLFYEINEEMGERFASIEEQLQKIFWFIEFHLGEVPRKYKKIYPQKGEYPYFKTKADFSDIYQIMPLCPENPLFRGFEMPKDPEAYKDAKERMLSYDEKIRNDTEQLRQYYTKFNRSKPLHVPDLNDDKYWGNEQLWADHLAKQDSSAASSTSSAESGSQSVNMPDESSPSSQEQPGHNNPPSQT